MSVQIRSVLYGQRPDSALLPEGVHDAELVEARPFANVFGERIGLVFRVTAGKHLGVEVMESAAPTRSPRGKLAELLRGMGAADWTLAAAQELVGRRCKILVKHETTKTGKPYSAVTQTFR